MTEYGVTLTGFSKKSLDVSKSEIEESLRASLGDGISLLSTGVLGQIVGIIAEREAEIWDVAEEIYDSQYPLSASGQSLDNICTMTGVTRLPASKTSVNVHCTGTPATSLPIGRIVSNDQGVNFESVAAATLALAPSWAINTAYAAGLFRTNNGNIYVCTISGISDGAGGPTTTGDGIVDNTCEWNFVGDGTGFASVQFEAENTGPISCAATAIHTEIDNGAIETPVSGWNDARNLEDGSVGRSLESDASLRIRRDQLLRSTGLAALDAITSKVLSVTDVESVYGFENTTDATDGAGRPPKSVEIVVYGGADQDIWDAIWESKPAGIATYGAEIGSAIDSNGLAHVVKFSRPTAVPITIEIDVDIDSEYPADGDTQIRNALVAYGDVFVISQDVYASQMYSSVFAISGVVNISRLEVGKPAPLGTSVTIADDEIATFSTTDIVIVTTP